MNSVPTKQCTKSKLSWACSAHTLTQPTRTLRAHYAQAARTPSVGRCVMARRALYRGRARPCRRRVTARTGCVVSRVSGARCCVAGPLRSRYKLYITTQVPASRHVARVVARDSTPLHRVAGRCCAVSQPVSLPMLRHKGHPQPQYNICIATPPLAKPRTPLRAASRVVAHVGHVVGPCRGHPAARPNALCHDTMHYIVTKAGKWAVAHPTVFANPFFFLPFFFPFLLQIL